MSWDHHKSIVFCLLFFWGFWSVLDFLNIRLSIVSYWEYILNIVQELDALFDIIFLQRFTFASGR